MNRPWVRKQLKDFIALTNEYVWSQDPAEYTGDETLLERLNVAEPTIRQIFATLDPKLETKFNLDALAGPENARTLAQRALGILDSKDAWAENLSPDAPTLRADQFHPWVWASARTLWESKHYRSAVEAATNAVNAFTQTKVDRLDISGTELMNSVFAEKPKPGQNVLRFAGNPTDETVKNHRALRPFAEGCFAGIRNPATHEHGDDWGEQKALEYLAAFSILARWIDECDVVDTP